jgi:tetratricopeptide (TPR) repeat protein
MPLIEEEELFTVGMDNLLWGNTRAALECFRKLVAIERVPVYCSSLGYCLAKEKGEIRQAISLCGEAIRKEPKNSSHFLNLGRVYLMAGDKKEAIRIFRMGLRHERNREIVAELDRLGTRSPPPISFLGRDNPLNKYLGLVLKKTGIRR